MIVTILDVLPKVDQEGIQKETKSGKKHWSVVTKEGKHTAYGDDFVDKVGQEVEADIKEESYMGHDYTVIWPPKLQPEKPLLETYKEVVAEKAKEKVLPTAPTGTAEGAVEAYKAHQTDEVVGKVRNNIAVAFISQGASLDEKTIKEMNQWVTYVMKGGI